MRYCDSCSTKLPGKGHGFVTDRGKLVCGRSLVQKTERRSDGTTSLTLLPTPGCRA